MTAEQVAAKLHIKVPAVKRVIPRLTQHGLLLVDGDTLTGVSDVDLDEVAAAVGAAGYREQLKAKFAVDQAANLSERMDWYSERVQAQAAEWAELDERFDAATAEAQERLQQIQQGVPGWVPDPFDGVPTDAEAKATGITYAVTLASEKEDDPAA